MSATEGTSASAQTEIRPFRVDVLERELEELRRRIDATRWPTRELVSDRSQGVQLAALRELARYWASEYDWRQCEARLNALPQFKTKIDGLDIHFIHVKSAHENALPLIMTHGWPGSVIELLETVGPLTDPTAHGGRPEDAFHLVLPSIPGYGFSEEPAELGWGPIRIGRAWDELMQRLGYMHYVAQGGDVGSQVTDAMARIGLGGLLGVHTNLLTPALGDAKALSASPPTAEEQAALDQLAAFAATGTGYFVQQATRPETIGYALLDSPVALAAWIIDHDTDAYQKIAHAFVDNQPAGNLTRQHIVDNITLYWLTGTGASAARSYWEEAQENARTAVTGPTPALVPVGFTTFPGEIWKTPRSWVERAYPNIMYFNEVDRGGHFAAWEEPQLFSEEMRACFRTLRSAA
jgi:pimeloyl-ACP methyl ester carboxylesterase